MASLIDKSNQILTEKNTNLIPENLKAGVTCLGVTGTYEGSSSTIEGIKQFSTIEEMQADPTAKEGDLAVVYRSETQNAKVDSQFQVASFPETVVLDTAITDFINIRYRAVDSSVMFDCMGSLDSSRFIMDCYTNGGSIRIQYTSSDGITYTRTDTTGNPVDFGTEIYYEMPERWNDVIGKFIQLGGSTFEGLFEYNNYKTEDFALYDAENYTYDENNNILIVPKLNIRVKKSDVYDAMIALRTLLGITAWGFDIFVSKDYNKIILCVAGASQTDVDTGSLFLTDNKLYYGRNTDIKYYVRMFEYTIATKQIIPIELPTDTVNFYYTSTKSNTAYRLNAYPIGSCISDNQYERVVLNYYKNPAAERTLDSYHNILYYTESIYKLAETQLTATPDYVYEKEFYGKNGIENGALTQNVSNSFTDINAKVYSKIKSQYENIEPRVLTDDDKTIDTNIYCIPVKSDGTPLLDTSSVTNMESMFTSCTNLTTIPELNTSNVTNMHYMFYNCKSLTTIPLLNTSSVTNMERMFQDCTNLTTIPLLDTSSVTNMDSMFTDCTNLTTIPLLDTSSATNMTTMFLNCTNLTTIPLLDTSSVTGMTKTFYGCTSLSDESLNNILAMCKNATSFPYTKTLKFIGLTSEQATKCTTLSNYSAFTTAGWTTGY